MKLLTLIFFLFLFLRIEAQPPPPYPTPTNEVSLLMKYWYYRNRLVNNFMIGNSGGFGEGIPSQVRNRWKEEVQDWGDATIHMGTYIGVLATEYKLLTLWGQTDAAASTEQELQNALSSFDILDMQSESIWFRVPPATSGNANGFFVRDNVGVTAFDYPSKSQNSNYNNIINHLNRLSSSDPYGKPLDSHSSSSTNTKSTITSINISNHELGSEFCLKYIDGRNNDVYEESKDQVVAMFTGLRLVKQFVPSASQHAEDIALRIMEYIHSPNNILKTCDWYIYDPIGNKVHIGNNFSTWAYGLSKTYKAITGKNNPNKFTSLFPCWASRAAAFTFQWQFYQAVYSPIKREGWKFLELVASSGCSNSTEFSMFSRAFTFSTNPYVHIPLLWNANNSAGGGLPFNQAGYINLLCAAPCFGPYFYDWSDVGNLRWATMSVLRDYDKQGDVDFTGEYNGLDYMLLYNLYLLKYEVRGEADYLPLYDTKIRENFPWNHAGTPNLGQGSASSPAFITSHRSIESNTTINSNGDVTFRSGYEIDLNPGFNSQKGSNFLAYISPFNCSAPMGAFSCSAGGTYWRNNNGSGDGYNLPQNKATSGHLSVFPIPSLGEFNFQFVLEKNAIVQLIIYDIAGRKIQSVIENEQMTKGEHFVHYSGSNLVSGVYIAKLIYCDQIQAIRIIKTN